MKVIECIDVRLVEPILILDGFINEEWHLHKHNTSII